MNKLISLPALFTLVFGSTHLHAAGAISKRFDFAGKPENSFQKVGIDFSFADLPANQNINGIDLSKVPGATLPERMVNELSSPLKESDLYQLTQIYDRLDAKTSGEVIAYHNRSDDTDVNMHIVVGNSAADKLKPNTTYLITAKIDFVTNVSADQFGTGGSANSNSFGLLASQNPWTVSVPGAAGKPNAPAQPSKGYDGIPAKFLISEDELTKIEAKEYDTLTADETALLSKGVTVSPSNTKAYKDALLKALQARYTNVLASLDKGAPTGDALNIRIAAELDVFLRDRLTAMSDEDKEALKSMFSDGGSPAVALTLAAVDENSNAMLRTSTLDSQGRRIELRNPSGYCGTKAPSDSTADERWVCDHYSYMGRIDNGLETANDGAFVANSISTKVPLTFKTDASGKPLYLNLNSHSGFEGLTVYYVTGIEYRIVEKK
ncbi:MAG: hypothetical protein H7249_00145 [Chitinophagaceae bacterium]|nr:hypothetical protein [Oligoflexus sp.]